MTTDKYRKENTYLLKIQGVYCRWQSDNQLAYFGSATDALEGIGAEYNAEAIKVIDCELEIQKEYEKLIDKEL